MNLKKLLVLGNNTWQQFCQDNCSQMAAAISYHVLFALVPLLTFAVSLIGIFAGSPEAQQRLAERTIDYLGVDAGSVDIVLSTEGIERITAEQGAQAVDDIQAALTALSEGEKGALADELAAEGSVTVAGYQLSGDDIVVATDSLLVETLQSAVATSPSASVVSFVILAYTASGLFGIMRRSLDAVWNVEHRRPFVPGKLFDLIMLLIVVLGIVSLIAASIAITAILASLRLGGTLWSATWALAPWAATFTFCLLMYRYGPHVHNRFRDVWPGAVLTATAFEVLKFGYTIYIVNFNNFDVIYGALAGAMLFLLFIYLAAYVFFMGAEVASEYPRVLSGAYASLETHPAGPPRSLRQSMVDMVRSLFVSKEG